MIKNLVPKYLKDKLCKMNHFLNFILTYTDQNNVKLFTNPEKTLNSAKNFLKKLYTKE